MKPNESKSAENDEVDGKKADIEPDNQGLPSLKEKWKNINFNGAIGSKLDDITSSIDKNFQYWRMGFAVLFLGAAGGCAYGLYRILFSGFSSASQIPISYFTQRKQLRVKIQSIERGGIILVHHQKWLYRWLFLDRFHPLVPKHQLLPVRMFGVKSNSLTYHHLSSSLLHQPALLTPLSVEPLEPHLIDKINMVGDGDGRRRGKEEDVVVGTLHVKPISNSSSSSSTLTSFLPPPLSWLFLKRPKHENMGPIMVGKGVMDVKEDESPPLYSTRRLTDMRLNDEMVVEIIAAEEEARKQKRGVWAHDGYKNNQTITIGSNSNQSNKRSIFGNMIKWKNPFSNMISFLYSFIKSNKKKNNKEKST